MNDTVIFEDDGHPVEVHLRSETLWLRLMEFAELFGRDKSVISHPLKNIFESNELERMIVAAKKATTAAGGKSYQVNSFRKVLSGLGKVSGQHHNA